MSSVRFMSVSFCVQSDHGQLTFSSRSAHGQSRLAHCQLTVSSWSVTFSSRSAHGQPTVSSWSAHGQLTLGSRLGEIFVLYLNASVLANSHTSGAG